MRRARRGALRPRAARRVGVGATVPEYALVLAAVVVVLIGVAGRLTDRSQAEVVNQAECVSFRPPPPECQLASADTTSSTTGGGPTTSTPTTVAPPGADPEFSNPRSEPTAANWAALVDITVTSNGTPVEGVEVRVSVQPTQPSLGQPFFLSCVTDATGTCTIRFDVPSPATTAVTITVEDVFTVDERPVGDLPDPVEIARP